MTPVKNEICVEDFTQLESEYLSSVSKPLVGYLCLRVPVELIEAYGGVPIRIVSQPGIEPERYTFIRSDACSFCRSVPAVMNSEPYRRLDAVIAGACCDQVRRLMETLNDNLDIPVIFYGAPRTWDCDKSYFLTEMSDAFDRLGETIGTQYSEGELIREGELKRVGADLSSPIALGLSKLAPTRPGHFRERTLDQYIDSRNRLRKLVSQLRDKGGLPGMLLQRIASSPLPAENVMDFLNALKPERNSGGRVRLMLVGSIPSGKELALIEEMGGLVVADATCLGDRVFILPVSQSNDPIEFLYHHYVENNLCPHRRPYTRLIEYIKEMIERRKIEGVIYRSVKFCHPYGLAATRFKTELNVPFLELDDDLTLQAVSSFRTRIGAFVEMLEVRTGGRGNWAVV